MSYYGINIKKKKGHKDMKHKKNKREVKRTIGVEHGYLYRSMEDERPLEGSIIFPIYDYQRGVFFIPSGRSEKDRLNVSNEEGCVSHNGMVWFYYRASKREVQKAYSEYNRKYCSSLMRNASLSERVTACDCGIGSV